MATSCVIRSGPPGASFLPLYLAESAGLYAKHGLAADLGTIKNSPSAAADLAAGRVHVSAISLEALLEACAEGHQLVFISGGTNALLFSLWARSGIDSIADLRGKRVGIATLGSTSHFALRLALEQLGEEGEHFEVVETKNQGRLPLLERDELDAGILSPPDSMLAARAGLTQLVDLATSGIAYPQGGMATSAATARAERETLKRFLRAYLEAIQVGKADALVGGEVATRVLGVSDPSLAFELGRDVLQNHFKLPPYGSIEGVEQVLRIMERDTGAPLPVRPESAIDNSLLDELVAEGFVASLAASGVR